MFIHTSNDKNIFKAQDAGRILSTVEKRTSGFSMVNVAKCIIPSSSMRPRLKEGTSKICASSQNNALKCLENTPLPNPSQGASAFGDPSQLILRNSSSTVSRSGCTAKGEAVRDLQPIGKEEPGFDAGSQME